jgi:hypothetical protein
MNILTPYGYKDISIVNIGDTVIGYDNVTNSFVNNILEDKEEWTPTMDNYTENHGDFMEYTINGVYVFYKGQSVFTSSRLVHASDLQVGDIIYDDNHNPITITSITTSQGVNWWRLSVSGNHTYIGDGILLHNANRYWVGGGSSENWNATINTNWGSASGLQDNSSVPGSGDAVIFDGAGVGGNTDSIISAIITVQSLLITSGYTATMTHNAVLTVGGNVTFGANYIIAGTSGITISFTSTITSNGITWPNDLSFSGTNTKTLFDNLNVSGTLNFIGNTVVTTSTGASLTSTSTLQISGVTFTNFVVVNANNVTINASSVLANNNTFNCSGTYTVNSTSAQTLTAAINFNGPLIINSTVAFNSSNASTLNINDGVTLNAGTSGTAIFRFISGTWSQGATTYGIANNKSIEGSFIVGTNATVSGGIVTYVSGTPIVAGTILRIRASCTFDTGGMNWGGVTVIATSTITLTSNLNTSEVLTISASSTFNTSNSSLVNILGGLNVTNTLTGTCKVVLLGGTITASGTSGIINNNVDIDGDVTFSGNVKYGTRTLTYVSGIVTVTNSFLDFTSACTLNTGGMIWNNITATSNLTVTLLSNLNCKFALPNAARVLTINKTTSEVINCYGTSAGNALARLEGNITDFYLVAGNYSSQTQINFPNLYIAGDVSYSTNPLRFYGTNLSYLSGDPIDMGITVYNTSVPITVDLQNQRVSWIGFALNTISNIINPILATNVDLDACLVNDSIGTNHISCFGGLRTRAIAGGATSTLRSSAKFVLKDGSNTQRVGNNSYGLSVDIIIDGNCSINFITFISSFPSNPMKIKYLSGIVSTSSSSETASVSLNGYISMDTDGMAFQAIYLQGVPTIEILSTLRININFTLKGGLVCTGTHGFRVEGLNSTEIAFASFNTFSNSNLPITLQAGVEYIAETLVSSRCISGSYTIQSSDPVQKAKFTLIGAINHGTRIINNRANYNFTRIDASNGRLIWTHASTVTDCLNIKPYRDLLTIGIAS